jgi:hypothetical protein
VGRHDDQTRYGHELFTPEAEQPTAALPSVPPPPVDPGDLAAEHEQLTEQRAQLIAAGVPPEQLAELHELPPSVRYRPLPHVAQDGPQLELQSEPIDLHVIDRKVWAAGIAGAAATALGAIATGVLDNLQLLDGIAPWARFLIVAVFVPAAGAIAAYVARSQRVG